MSTGEIPFLDLVTVHRELREELRSVFETALDSAAFVGGQVVQEFERDFAEFCESQFCVGMASGTDALRLALVAAGVQSGDTVVTVPLTFIATTEAISQAGARPDFVDIDERTYTMDPEKLRAYLETECTPNPETGRVVSKRSGGPVTAVIPVHLYGQMADMDPILELAARYDLIVIEDACQAHGAEYLSKKEDRWRKAGSMGHAAAFSFYPGKNLGACGEAGAVTTDDERLARRCQMLRDHGQSKKYFHDIEGYNGRLDAIQAGILRVKLRHLAKWNEQRRQRARGYDELFADADGTVILPHVPSWSRPVYHLYVVRVAERELLQKDLAAAGIGTGIHYPIPLHLAKAYEALGFRHGDFPVAEQAASQVLSLPMFPGLSLEQQERVVTCMVESTKATGQRVTPWMAQSTRGAVMSETKTIVVVGLGEVGKPILEIVSRHHEVVGVDVSSPTQRIKAVDVMHVCYPFAIEDFVGETARYIKLFSPGLTIVNSTVAVGTTRAIAERTGAAVVHSPVRGKHVRMLEEILSYTKFVGAIDPVSGERAAKHFESVGMKTRVLSSPEATELAKLTETTYFGLIIAWAQEVERYCDQLGQKYDEIVSFYEEVKFFPPVKYFPGIIGGHCVMPNIEILSRVRHSEILKTIQSSNRMKTERQARRGRTDGPMGSRS
jgi:dTDP-4-amino-4,6-dideoxygalactose transaminase